MAEVARLPKNSQDDVVIGLSEFQGHNLLDIRVFSKVAPSEKHKPTKKGISIRIERLAELIQALLKARDEATRRGLLKARRRTMEITE